MALVPTSSAPGVGPGLPPPPSVHPSYSGGPVSGPPPPPDQGHPSANSNQFFDDMDPNTLPPELKKEGSDWFAVFSQKTKRVLDVNLVHTLMHERYVVLHLFSHIPDGRVLVSFAASASQPMASILPQAAIAPHRSTTPRREQRLGMPRWLFTTLSTN
jgi:hypothetical protein